ncbi:nicotinic acid mononucleotide adenylyltransferase [Pelomyxa schiedti]|nr:nicotinic acid mononucleotide adenylyltransferase [Pelomyxa schiedti]
MALPLLQATIVDRPAVTPTVCSLLQHVESLLSGNTNLLLLPPNGQVVSTLPPGNRIIFTGSFNPFHIGHRALMREAESQLGSPTVYAELGVTNADKPGLSAAETLVRAAQFAGRWPLLLSRTALFIDKARLYPGSTFLVGTDTVVRLLNTKYYNNSEEEATRVLGEIQSLGCKFLVAGRKMDNGYQTLTTLLPTLPMQQFHGLLSELPFRLDISSTELRRAGNKGTR